MEDIKSSCTATVDILNDLLTFEKMDSGIMTLHKEHVKVLPMLLETTQIFLAQVRRSTAPTHTVDMLEIAYNHHVVSSSHTSTSYPHTLTHTFLPLALTFLLLAIIPTHPLSCHRLDLAKWTFVSPTSLTLPAPAPVPAR